MKKLFFSTFKSFLTVLIFISYCTVVFSQDCEFPPNCADVVERTIELDVPGYSNSDCKILVTYKKKVCAGETNIYNFVYMPLGNCSDFKVQITSNAQFVRNLDLLAGRQVANSIAKKVIYESGADPDDFSCNGTDSKVVSVSYVRGSCIAIWEGVTTVPITIPGAMIKVTKKDPTLPGEFPFIITQLAILTNQDTYATVACADGCCKLKRSYCNKNGVLTATEVEGSANPTDPTNPKGKVCPSSVPPPPSDFLPGNVTWIESSPCFIICDRKGIIQNKVVKNTVQSTETTMFFRNPINGNLVLNFLQETNGTIEIQDINGRTQRQISVNQDKSISIDMYSVPVGVYFVVLKHSDGRMETKKLVNQ